MAPFSRPHRTRYHQHTTTTSSTPGAAVAATDTRRAEFDQRYDTHLRHLRLKGLRPKTIEAYARGIRRMGEYFDYRIDALGGDQLSRYFKKTSTPTARATAMQPT